MSIQNVFQIFSFFCRISMFFQLLLRKNKTTMLKGKQIVEIVKLCWIFIETKSLTILFPHQIFNYFSLHSASFQAMFQRIEFWKKLGGKKLESAKMYTHSKELHVPESKWSYSLFQIKNAIKLIQSSAISSYPMGLLPISLMKIDIYRVGFSFTYYICLQMWVKFRQCP